MPGRKPLLDNDEPLVISALKDFSLRNQALIILGLNTGFRITELLSLTVGQVWDAGKVKPQLRVSRAQLKGGRGCHRKTIVSRSVPLNAAAAGSARISRAALGVGCEIFRLDTIGIHPRKSAACATQQGSYLDSGAVLQKSQG
jgi:integrase